MKKISGNNSNYIYQKFDDFEALKEAAKLWSLDLKQLDSGKLEGDVAFINFEELSFGTVNFDRRIEQKGETPKGFRTIALPADNRQAFKWRNYKISSNDLMIYPKSNEIDAVSHFGFNVYTVSLKQSFIDEYCDKFEGNQLKLIDDSAKVIKLSFNGINILRNQLKYFFTQLNLNPKKINSHAFNKIVVDEFPSLLLTSILENQTTTKLPSSRIRDISLKKSVEYIRENSIEMPTVYELCLISGASQRTLEYAFKEKFGVGPKEYMKNVRLNHIRRELIKSDPKHVKVQDIAHQYGFLHLGHFGSEYKKLFGELPSQTLLI